MHMRDASHCRQRLGILVKLNYFLLLIYFPAFRATLVENEQSKEDGGRAAENAQGGEGKEEPRMREEGGGGEEEKAAGA